MDIDDRISVGRWIDSNIPTVEPPIPCDVCECDAVREYNGKNLCYQCYVSEAEEE